MKALVLAGSRGIGKGIADSLEKLKVKVVRTSTKTLDTSNIKQVEKFIKKVKSIVENNIKYLTGNTINFDGGKSNFIF